MILGPASNPYLIIKEEHYANHAIRSLFGTSCCYNGLRFMVSSNRTFIPILTNQTMIVKECETLLYAEDPLVFIIALKTALVSRGSTADD
jgi:hypothetical protein